MIQRTIKEIEERIEQARSIPEDKRAELIDLFGVLRSEIAEIGEAHGETAREIAGHTERSTSEVTRDDPDRANLQRSLEGLSSSVVGFEESHPRLVSAVNRICVTLSSLGI